MDVAASAAGLSGTLLDIYLLLHKRFGHRNWWPGDTPFEVIVGAILTQNTAWTNVERAIANLKSNGGFSAHGLLKLETAKLAGLIRPSGYFNQKALRLKAICQYLVDRCGADLELFKAVPTDELRKELLAITGIGPETADSILLYALDRPVFVVDTYTRRALGRIGLIAEMADYHTVQRLFMDNLALDVELFNDYHAQWVALGKDHCRQKPVCGGCPMREICLNKEVSDHT